ncbi:hypothetical protein CSB37_03830 [bacterium DOLZORAL124_38_8]|nr:MAG: hypothetical protein CSB37_03830 [bacterium DOLZORAL124_38_8]
MTSVKINAKIKSSINQKIMSHQSVTQQITPKYIDSLQEKISDIKEQHDGKILILTHANPDGDAIGSAYGLYLGFKSLGLTPTVSCIDEVPTAFKFVDTKDTFTQTPNFNDFKNIVFVDCGDKKLTRFDKNHPEILSDQKFKINIDHHPSNDNFGDLNLVITNASSAAEIVYYLWKKMGVEMNSALATSLLLGIYTDTGGFVHQNTTPDSYTAAAELVELGGSVSKISQNVFRSNDLKQLKLWGKVLEELHVTDEGAAIVGVHKDDYLSLGATRQDLGGVIDLINSMPEVQYSVMLSEDEKGNVKASLRTRKDDVNVKAIAEKFGGGGHVKAAGFTVPQGHLKKEVKWKIVTDA